MLKSVVYIACSLFVSVYVAMKVSLDIEMNVSISPWHKEGILLCESRHCQEDSQEKEGTPDLPSTISISEEVDRAACI